MKIIKLSFAQRKELSEIVSRFSSYSSFSKNKECAYKYAMVFGIKICPYCNIHYIDTVYNATRPEFDHFIPKSSPAGRGLELDIDNLVPSCHVCNSTIKRSKIFRITTHIHPFYDDFDTLVKFVIDLKTASYLAEDSFDLNISCITQSKNLREKAFNSIRDLKLYARYQAHKNSVVEYLKFVKHYNFCYRKNLGKMFNFDTSEIMSLEKLLTGFLDSDINRTSLGKLRKDILGSYSD